ncbi:MAG TPA: TolC family protein [Bacteroidales bacterium]|nr:TolC family protein [Bacteroidales bacterium]
MKKYFTAFPVWVCLIIFVNFQLVAQTEYRFSLDEAINFALENNYDLLSSYKDIETAEAQVKEYMAIGFPQVNASVNYTDYLALPTMIIPAGTFGPDTEGSEIQFGTKYNASASATASQLIFDGKYIVGVQASRKLLEKNQQQFIKTKLDMYEAVSAAYYRVLVAENTRAILDSTKRYMDGMLYETQNTFEAGFAEETDVDQLQLIVSDLEANIILTETQVEIAYAFLKFLCGMKIDDEIFVTDKLEDLMTAVNYTALLEDPFNYENNIDYRLLKTQQDIAELQLRLQKSEYLPNLSAFINYQTQAQRSEWSFFNTKGKWYGSSFWGVEMNIPIWSSGVRSARVQQARINMEKLSIADQKLRTGLTIQVKTAQSEFNNSYLVMMNKSLAMSTAEKILRITSIKYKEGISSSLDLLQANNQFLGNTSDYIVAMQDVLIKKLALEKLMYSDIE